MILCAPEFAPTMAKGLAATKSENVLPEFSSGAGHFPHFFAGAGGDFDATELFGLHEIVFLSWSNANLQSEQLWITRRQFGDRVGHSHTLIGFFNCYRFVAAAHKHSSI